MMTAPSTQIRSVDDLRGRQAVVLGLARSGIAASRFLADAGAEVTAYDRRSPDDLAEAIASLEDRPIRLALGIDESEATRLIEFVDVVLS